MKQLVTLLPMKQLVTHLPMKQLVTPPNETVDNTYPY